MDNVIYHGLLFLAVFIGYAVRSIIRPKAEKVLNELDPDQLEGLSKWALKLCRAAKNMSNNLSSGYARRNWVLEQLTDLCDRLGVDITDEQKRALLEAAYDEMLADDNFQVLAAK